MTDVIVCVPVADLPVASPGSERVSCGACAAVCWIGPAGQTRRARGPIRIACIECARDEVRLAAATGDRPDVELI